MMANFNTEGVTQAKKDEVVKMVQLLKTHGLEKVYSKIKGKAIDPSLDIKRKYINDALKRIKTTKYETWAKRQKLLAEGLSELANAVTCGLEGNFAGSIMSLGKIASSLYSSCELRAKHLRNVAPGDAPAHVFAGSLYRSSC